MTPSLPVSNGGIREAVTSKKAVMRERHPAAMRTLRPGSVPCPPNVLKYINVFILCTYMFSTTGLSIGRTTLFNWNAVASLRIFYLFCDVYQGRPPVCRPYALGALPAHLSALDPRCLQLDDKHHILEPAVQLLHAVAAGS